MDNLTTEGISFFVARNNTRFVALHDGLAYWFVMKDQYLYQVTTDQEFYRYNGDDGTPERFRYVPTNTGYVSLRGLMGKRRYFMMHPVNQDGCERIGVELVKQKYHEVK